jgi:hypothetical protein
MLFIVNKKDNFFQKNIFDEKNDFTDLKSVYSIDISWI